MSCMATTTTNLGLTKPDYTDAADIAVINTNMDTVDTAITATKSDLGIVEDGNTATHSITAGQYVIWKGNLYTASSAIATGTTLSTSNLTAVSNGGLNSLNEQIANISTTGTTQLSTYKMGTMSIETNSELVYNSSTRVIQIKFQISSGAQLSAGNTYTVGSVGSAYKPLVSSYCMASRTDNGTEIGRLNISPSNGSIDFRALSNVPSGVYLFGGLMYFY